MPVLTAQDAQQIRLAKKGVNHETYKMLFDMAIQRIKLKAEMNHTSVRYKIPHYVLGRPAINVHHAARYVSEKLKFYGYKTSYHEADGSFFIDIDWSLEPIKVQKKPRDVKRPKGMDASVKSNPQEAIRRMEMIKLQLQRTMKNR
ncbi:hypothetical protein PBCVNEJV1_712R [Paramecium bursaria Chlorella virus NE-JV-1]|nr:hypothetical protein PBCVNEJV1_712R [Paramecium bursaria Chlorella virus NE-JV-1]